MTDKETANKIEASDKEISYASALRKTPNLAAAFIKQRNQSKNTLTSDIIQNHSELQYYTAKSMFDFLNIIGFDVRPLSKGHLQEKSFQDGGGYKIYFGGDGEFQYHPLDGSHHKNEYWKVSGGKEGTRRYGMDGEEVP